MEDKPLTKSAQQTLVFFEDFIRKKEVTDFVCYYREYLNLPKKGIEFTDYDREQLKLPCNLFFYIPHRVRDKFPKEEADHPFRVINTCHGFVAGQCVDSNFVKIMLTLYLFYNKTIDLPMREYTTWDDLLKIEHIPSELSWYSDEDHFLLKKMYSHFNEIGKKYSIALYINPEASQRQVQDFISKNWDFIKHYEVEDKKVFSNIRKKSSLKQKRNDFIYKNKNLPRKKIMQMVNDEFPNIEPVDYGNVGKIISLEKKRRENK